MSLSNNPATILLETNAQLLKNAIDSLIILRNIISHDDPQVGELLNKAIRANAELRRYLETTQDYPHWVDTWGQPRRWEHPSK